MLFEMFRKKYKESETVVVVNGGNQINLDSVNALGAKWTTRGGFKECDKCGRNAVFIAFCACNEPCAGIYARIRRLPRH